MLKGALWSPHSVYRFQQKQLMLQRHRGHLDEKQRRYMLPTHTTTGSIKDQAHTSPLMHL